MNEAIRNSAIVAVIALLASSMASADVVAGWDFSQYLRGHLTIDGSTYADTLGANYSHRDESLNLGPDSASFGTAFFNGAMGSSNVDELSLEASFYPSGGDPSDATQRKGAIFSNRKAPVRGQGDNRFDSFAALRSEGQQFTNAISMRARDSVDVVFQADAGTPTSGWAISFGARAARGAASISVEHDVGCSGSYTTHPSSPVALTGEDTAYKLEFPAESGSTACVRLGLDPGTGEPLLDNVAIELVPEPGSQLLQIAALATLALLARRSYRGAVAASRV